MIPAAARAFERLFSAVLVPAAGAVRAIAWIAFAVVLFAAIAQAVRAFLGARHGWEAATVVRCRSCGAVAADAADPRCANGHPVRFPPGAAHRESRRRGGTDRGLRGAPGIAVAVALAVPFVAIAGMILAARVFRIADGRTPTLAAVAGACGFLAAAAAAAAFLRAASSTPRGALDRGLSAFLAALALVPAALFLAFARAADPAPPATIGSLWATPTGLYVAEDRRARRARRVLDSGPPSVSADVVVAQCPVFALQWTGLARIGAGRMDAPWTGSGGTRARFLGRLPSRALSPFFTVDRTRVVVATPANVRVWIVRSADRILFSPDTETHPSFDASTAED